jgi:two-component system NarL family response regulator
VNILLVDDHPLFLDGLSNLLTAHGQQVIGTARDGFDALEKARSLRPDVILMDIRMPRCDGLCATRLIKAEMPEVQVVMLTMSDEEEDLFEAIRCGATGYLLKTQNTEQFFDLLAGLAHGEVALAPVLARRVLVEIATISRATPHSTQDLSSREMQVLTLVAHGKTYKEVGAELGLTERTVKYHMGRIIERLHLANRSQVLEYARKEGLAGKT